MPDIHICVDRQTGREGDFVARDDYDQLREENIALQAEKDFVPRIEYNKLHEENNALIAEKNCISWICDQLREEYSALEAENKFIREKYRKKCKRSTNQCSDSQTRISQAEMILPAIIRFLKQTIVRSHSMLQNWRPGQLERLLELLEVVSERFHGAGLLARMEVS